MSPTPVGTALRSIKYRLTLIFFSITLGAILVIYFYVVPQLQSNLTHEKLNELTRDAATYSNPFQEAIGRDVTARELDALTRRLAEQSGADVTLLGIPRNELDEASGGKVPPYVISDSREAQNRLQPSSAAVLTAAEEGAVQTTTSSSSGERLAQAAKPLLYQGEASWVVVFSEGLDDVDGNVALIRRQILVAGLIALAVALVSSYYASSALSRRVKRLERAAREVAAGNFSEPPIPVDSEDELGQLARAFNEMQRKLAGLDKARKEFIANASHELRTPIFSLGGFVELLQDEEMDEDTRTEFLITMREQVDRLGNLATDLLDLSRLDAGSLDLDLHPVPLGMLAEQVVGEFAAAAARQGTEIDVSLAQANGDVLAECDPQRTAQILRALVDNAITHTGEGASISVGARARRSATAPRWRAEVEVTDNGPGIPRSDLENVFDRFHTGNTGPGSGLGLAIARELAERMQGSLSVVSRPGRTIFKLSLPLASEPVSDARPAADPIGAGSRGGTRT